MWTTLSDKKTVCHLHLLLTQSFSGLESHEIHDHILLSQIRDSPSLEGQVFVLISHRNRVAQLYPQGTGFPLLTSCDLQGYGEDFP
jgi:hypothetical protein